MDLLLVLANTSQDYYGACAFPGFIRNHGLDLSVSNKQLQLAKGGKLISAYSWSITADESISNCTCGTAFHQTPASITIYSP